MPVVGRILSEARTSRGLTLDDVERETRIAKRYLEALEHDEFDALPAPVYCRAFLRTYAQFLSLDSKELMRLYPEKGREPAELAPLPQVTKAPPPALSLNWVVAGGVMLVFLLAGLLLFRLSSGGGENTPIAGVSAQATQVRNEGAEPLTAQPTLAPAAESASAEAVAVTVPDVRGFDARAALPTIADAGLTYVAVSVYDDAPAGSIIGQDPSPDSDALSGDVLTLLVSRGPRP